MQSQSRLFGNWNGMRLGLGMAALGRPGYINLGHSEDVGEEKSAEVMEIRSHEMLDAAWGAGVRYFDVARSYGLAEAFLASWIELRKIKTDAIFVASKWGYRYTADWQVEAEAHEVKEHSLARLQKQIKESRALLGDHLKLYQVHSATLESGILENGEVLDELGELKAQGLLIGLSLSGAQQAETLARAMRIERNGERLFDAVQVTWNVLETSAGDQLQSAHDEGMRVIVKEALANGQLTARNHAPDFTRMKSVLTGIANRHESTIDGVALAAVFAQDWADIVLSGAARFEHLESNMRALTIELYEEELAELAQLKEDKEEYWQYRSKMEWN